MWAIRSLSLNSSERCEQIAQGAQKKWAMWANCSGRLPKMSGHEQFAHIAQRKWVIVSKSLRALTKNEPMSESLIFFCKLLRSLIFGRKKSDLLKKPMSEFPALIRNTFLKHFFKPPKWQNCFWAGQWKTICLFSSLLALKKIKLTSFPGAGFKKFVEKNVFNVTVKIFRGVVPS